MEEGFFPAGLKLGFSSIDLILSGSCQLYESESVVLDMTAYVKARSNMDLLENDTEF